MLRSFVKNSASAVGIGHVGCSTSRMETKVKKAVDAGRLARIEDRPASENPHRKVGASELDRLLEQAWGLGWVRENAATELRRSRELLRVAREQKCYLCRLVRKGSMFRYCGRADDIQA